MEENLDKINEENKEISDNSTKSNSEEIKGLKSEIVINMDKNNGDSATKAVIKNEINTSEKPITKPKKELPVEKKLSKMWKMILYLIMRKKWNQTLRCRHKGILEKLNQRFLLITE